VIEGLNESSVVKDEDKCHRKRSENVYSNETFFEQMEASYLPSRKQFFLYTINEHEALANKVFTARKNKSLTKNSILSKSDTNLSVTKY